MTAACQRCGSTRLLDAAAHCSDMFSGSIGGKAFHGYVPSDLGIGGGDDMEITLCLDCGQVQGTWPLPPSQHEAKAPALSAFAAEVVRVAVESDLSYNTTFLKLIETGKVEDIADGLRAMFAHPVRSVRNLADVLEVKMAEELDIYPAIRAALGNAGVEGNN